MTSGTLHSTWFYQASRAVRNVFSMAVLSASNEVIMYVRFFQMELIQPRPAQLLLKHLQLSNVVLRMTFVALKYLEIHHSFSHAPKEKMLKKDKDLQRMLRATRRI